MRKDEGRDLYNYFIPGADVAPLSDRYDAGEDVDGQMNSENPFGGMAGFPPGMEQMLFSQMFSQRGGFGGGGGARFGAAGGRRGGHSHSYSSGGGGYAGHSFDFY